MFWEPVHNADAFRRAGHREVLPAGREMDAGRYVALVESGICGLTTVTPEGNERTYLAQSGLTLVVYMGVSRVRGIVAALVAAGMDAATPAAVISQAHTPQQRHALCTLGTLAEVVQAKALGSPAILVIGDVVRVSAQWAVAQQDLAVRRA